MLEIADAAAGDYRDRHRIGNRPCQRQIKARFGAVAIHAGQQDFTRA
jgi:hypothetical protein